MNASLSITPHPKQQVFLDEDAQEQLYGGSKRSGKTVALCQKIALLLSMFPGNRGLLGRHSLTDLKDSTLVTLEQVVPADLIAGHNKNDRTYFFETGERNKKGDPVFSHLIYRGLGDKDDLEKAKGLETGVLGVDEPSEIIREIYLMLRSQIVWRLPDGTRPPYMSLLACNPEPGWVKEDFYDTCMPFYDENTGVARCGNKVFIPALPRDNPGLPEGWEEELRAVYPKEWVEKYLDGSWEISDGMVFTEWDDRTHTFDQLPEGFIDQLELYGALDHAATGITAFTLIGVDAWGNMFVLAEYYMKDQLISQHAFGIKELIKEWTYRGDSMPPRQLKYVLIDPSTTARTQQGSNSLQSVAYDYINNGLAVIPAWNALELGINFLKEMMHVNPLHRNPLTGLIGGPMLFVNRNRCRNLIKEIKGLKKEILESGLVRYKGLDHALDTIRYICNSRPRPSTLRKHEDLNMTAADRRHAAIHRRFVEKFGNGGNGQTWYREQR